MPNPQTIIRDGSGTRTATYQLPPGLFQYIESILVELDNGAAVAVRPTLKVETVNGQVMATKRQGESVPAGDTGTATWALRLTDEDGGGIKFDTYPQSGDFLRIETTGVGPNIYGIELKDDGNVVSISSDDDEGGGEIRLRSPFIRFDTDGVSLRLLDSGETFFECGGNASWSFVDFVLETNAGGDIGLQSDGDFSLIGDNAQMEIRSGAGMLFEVNGGSANFTFEQWQVVGTSITLDSSTVLTLEGNSVDINIGTGSTLTVNNHLGQTIFRVNEDGSLQGKTGKTLTFNL